MAYTLARIGKSLVKYFKPVRVAAPHLSDSANASGPRIVSGDLDESKRGLKLLKFKKPERDKLGESKTQIRLGIDETHVERLEHIPPEKVPSQWIDLVIFLLQACKRASQKIRKRVGIDAYKNSMLNRGRLKLKTVGSIVDTNCEDIETTEKKAA